MATMFDRNGICRTGLMLLAGVLVSSILVSPIAAQAPSTGAQAPAPAAKPAVAAAPYRRQSVQIPRRAQDYYAAVWGIESPIVKVAESGEIIRFSWRVIDAERAKPLNDKKFDPSLIDPQAGVRLVVPTLEKVGQLRQSSTPEAGKTYWMAFSNSGRIVKPGHRVIVQIGPFQAEGLVVQ
ncbi:MAG: hypothetical protein WBL63_04730 [Candidatus Acidiferrum sp.]